MADRVDDVLQVLEGEEGARDAALTSAFKLAVQQGVPDDLAWEVAYDTRGCFRARGGGRLYSINVLSGTVLVDGNPPGRLPAAILEHPLYKAVFGDKSFEVSVTADRVYCVTRPVGKRWYEFSMLDGNRLVAVETDDTQGGARLELLDTREEGWARDLPVRLRELHSHWLCRNPGIHPDGFPFVVFRPRDFRQRQAAFIMECDAGMGACWGVPEVLARQPSTALVRGMRRQLAQKLMLATEGAEDPLLRVLAKFEPLQFIHIFQDGARIYFHLPRHKLEFVLKQGRVDSLD
eukprot:jgi/Mesvir1/21536/Mv03977-RA.1